MKEIRTIKDLEQKYELELDKIIAEIKKTKAKTVLLQFPDGIKPYATSIVDELEARLKDKKIEFFIWFGSCYGGCDLPILGIAEKDFDLIIQFGHTEFKNN